MDSPTRRVRDIVEVVEEPATVSRTRTDELLGGCRSSMVPVIGGTVPQVFRLMLKRLQFALGFVD